ncbi:MAG: DNA topoisomerase IB [Gemmatirosa sp.]
MAQQWILRRGTKRSGFRYAAPGGRPASAAARTRAESLAVPPAWTDVHIAASPTAAVQAWGFDAKGRKQYRYHEKAAERGQMRKYYRVRQMARDLPRIREAVARDLGTSARRARGLPLTKQRVAAGVVRLIGEAFFRVGNERYAAENRTFGIATLRKRHVRRVDDRLVFDYVGKESVRQRQTVCDPTLVALVGQLLATPGPRLFRYQDDEGRWNDLSARDVNEYLHDVLGVPYTAKDFRTWGGTLRTATILADLGPASGEREARRNVTLAMRLVASELGNTPTVCRQSYVHPMVVARYLDEGTTIAGFLPRATARGATARRATATQLPEERALIGFLDRYFPERRQKRERRRTQRERARDRREQVRAA